MGAGVADRFVLGATKREPLSITWPAPILPFALSLSKGEADVLST